MLVGHCRIVGLSDCLIVGHCRIVGFMTDYIDALTDRGSGKIDVTRVHIYAYL